MFLEKFSVRTTVIGICFVLAVGFFAQSISASSISGFVFDKQRNRLPDVDMELLNEYYQQIRRSRTDSAGRYEFAGLLDGRYTVRALPFRYDLDDQEWPVEIVSFNIRGAGNGNTSEFRDFYLSPKKGGIAEAEIGVIFAQEVPQAAIETYKQALKDISEKRNQEGIDGLHRAIRAYPDYFDALYRMGKELYFLGKYDEAWQYLLRSTEINPKSGPSYYYMGYCFYKLGKDYEKASITSLKQAANLTPNSMQIFYALGMVERSAGKFSDSETHLLQAKKLANKPIAEIQKELSQLYANDLKKYKEAADELEIYLKTGKMSETDRKATKALIENLREKAKVQVGKS